MKTAIIIPARYGSTRLPAKPLAMIAGKTMLQRVVEIARLAQSKDPKNITLYVATDDSRITDHCDQLCVPWLMTPGSCLTGTDRALAAMQLLPSRPDFVLIFQGDAPLTPPDFLEAMIEGFRAEPDTIDMITPVTQMTWEQLDKLRESKKTTPFSGTTAVLLPNLDAVWFSKNIIPAMRKEDKLREASPLLSPVYRHIGLYGYSPKMLETYVTLLEGHYEAMEGLEQLRVLEHGYKIRAAIVGYAGRPSMSGVDSPEDITRAEELIKKHGL